MKKINIRDFFVPLVIALFSRMTIALAGITWNLTHDAPESLAELLFQLDAGWYQTIIENGYMKLPLDAVQPGAANWAFFPLYPLIIGIVSEISGINCMVTGPVVSTLFFILAIIIIFQYVAMTRNYDTAVMAVTLIAFGPYSFYFSCLYTESLFLLLVALCFYFLEKENWIAAGVCGAFLSATRVTGVFFVFPLLIKMIIPYLKENHHPLSVVREILKDENKILALSLIPIGLFAYMTFLYFFIGDPFAFANVQVAWNREITNPVVVLYRALTGSFAHKYLALWGILAIFCSVYLAINKRFSEAVFGFLTIAVSISTAVFSIPRFFVGCLVLVLGINDFISQSSRFRWPFICFLSSVNIFLLFLWFMGKYSVMQ